MKKPATLFVLAVALAGLTLAAWWVNRPSARAQDRPGKTEGASPVTVPPAKQLSPGAVLPGQTTASALFDHIQDLLGKLRAGGGSDDLGALRTLLLGADPREAMAAIQRFLQIGEDAPAGQRFGVGEGGTLAEATTLRVFLLDLLGQLAKTTGSGAAAQVGRAILENKTTPEEWAIAMRNVAWSEPDARAYLGGRVREMLADAQWSAAPSGGFLEAFDVIVWSGDPSFIDPLVSMVTGDDTTLKRAALVTLDRLSETAPLAVMEYLNTNPGTLAERPFIRADYFAKVDLDQPAQQVALETYLDRADVSGEEKAKLLHRLGVPASFVSDNLLTPPAPPDDGTARQKQVSALLGNWLTSNRFPKLNPEIRSAQGELSVVP